MSALVLLLLASAELTPPPVVEVSPEEPAKAPEVVKLEAPPGDGSPLEPNLGAQISVGVFQGLNGFLLFGVAACGAISCYYNSTLPLGFGIAGGLAGIGYALLDREVSLGWGRAALFDSLTVGAGFISVGLVALPALGLMTLGQVPAYTIMFLTDAALVAGASFLTRNVAPRAEAVLLADSLGLWGILLGDATAALLLSDRTNCILGGVLAGAVSGALLGATAERMSLLRVLVANLAAALGAMVVGGGMAIYETFASSSAQRPYNPTVSAAGVAAGIAGGFLVGFAFSESL